MSARPTPDPHLLAEVTTLVPEWLTVPDLVERCGVRLAVVHRWLDERELLGLRVGDPVVLRIPAGFLDGTEPLASLRGTFTVLADGGMNDAEIIRWLHTSDPTLPGEGTPLSALRAGQRTEIRRRAMEQAF